MKIKVLNWSDHSPKDKLKSPWWFKWHNAVALNVKFLPLKQREICALVYILSLASESGSDLVELSDAHMKVFARMDSEDFLQACEILSNYKLIRVIGEESRENPAEIPPENSGKIAGKSTARGEEKRGEESKEEPEQAPDMVALQPGFEFDPKAETLTNEELRATITTEGRTYDRDHESVAVKADPKELPRLAELWNSNVVATLQRVIRCSPPRRRKALSRWKEEPREEFWLGVFAKINASSFLTGQVPAKDDRKPFRADFDWLLEGSNVDKILEGKYDDRGPPRTPKSSYLARMGEQK